MSAGICGKRLGFEEIFGSPTPIPSAKRSCYSRYDSPSRSADFGFGAEDKVSAVLRMFPSMERKVVETVLNSHDGKIDDTIKYLNHLCLGDSSARNEHAVISLDLQSNGNSNIDVINARTSEQKYEVTHDCRLNSQSSDVSSWVDLFVHEMMNSSDWHDVRSRAMTLLKSFEGNVVVHSTSAKELEIASIKEQIQCLLRDNQILKRAVTIQHERNLECEEKVNEVLQLKNLMIQYQEQIRILELNNYALKIHLQRAQEASSIPSRFHPDII